MRLPPDVEERLVMKFDWIRLLERAPAKSPLYTHEDCGTSCDRSYPGRGYVSRLKASTIRDVGTALALRAEVDGADAWLGVSRLALAVKRDRGTVIKALGHLERKQLLHVRTRGGELGIPRSWATVYLLTRPSLHVLARCGLVEAEAYDWFQRNSAGGGAGAAAG